jgi:hypothetical protein
VGIVLLRRFDDMQLQITDLASGFSQSQHTTVVG